MRSLFRKKKRVIRVNNVRYMLINNNELVLVTPMSTSQKLAQVFIYLCNSVVLAASLYIVWLMLALWQVAYYE